MARPITQAFWDAGFADFAARFVRILQAFEEVDVNFALEVHPTEIAFKGDGTVRTFGGHTSFGDPRRNRDFRSVGREWEDSRLDRAHGATESAAFCRRVDFEPAKGAFDAVFDKARQGGMAGSAR
ncbi:MAG: hypothetical protein ACJ8GJ_14610 [Vitreoscilla sp.]